MVSYLSQDGFSFKILSFLRDEALDSKIPFCWHAGVRRFNYAVAKFQYILSILGLRGKKVKAFHTCNRALGPEPIPVYRQLAHR